ncbi:MAG: LemA family protein [Candidatus Micrarchaeia archaeon]
MLGLLLLAIGIVVVVIVLIVIAVWNALVALNNNAKKAWADIDVLLQKRHDALTKLIDTVSAYMKYEKGVMTQLTQLRSQWESIPQSDVQSKINTANQISAALKSVFAVAENYPDLKADNSFIQLQQTITDLESQLADRREYYNQAATDLNIRIQQFPFNVFAGMMHFKPMPLYQVPSGETADVKMNFNV